MSYLSNHLVKCFVAGIVAILPIAGLVLTVVYFENQVAGTWLKNQGFYFFGLGLIILILLIYLIGLTVSTFVGRWIWHRFDRLLVKLPVLGNLYQTTKQILGYGEGPTGIFQRVVLVPTSGPERLEIGLVTQEASADTDNKLSIFVPSAPAPTNGRLIYLAANQVQSTTLTVSEALQLLVSLGTVKTERPLFGPLAKADQASARIGSTIDRGAD